MYARSEEEIESALEEAVAAAILEEHSVVGANVTYRFTHAFFRQTLYDEIIAPRRIRLHQQIARVLEDVYGNRLEEHAAELAEHYAFSSDAADLAKAVHYGRLAARRAIDVFAYSEAGYQLERALQVQDLVDPDDAATRCDLLLALGEALGPTGDTEKVIRFVAPEALALAERLADRRRAFRACRLAVDSFQAQGASTFWRSCPNTSSGPSEPIATPTNCRPRACQSGAGLSRGTREVDSPRPVPAMSARCHSRARQATPKRCSSPRGPL